MKYYGYTRASTVEQKVDRGIREITEYCSNQGKPLEKIFTDNSTGTNFERKGYKKLKKVLKPGDVLIITEIDRLGREYETIKEEIDYFRQKKISLKILEIPTSLVENNFINENMVSMLNMLNAMSIEMFATFSQVETKKRKKRQEEGIQAMKARGEWWKYGRPRIIQKEEFRKLYKEYKERKYTDAQIYRELGISKSTMRKYKREYLESEEQSP